MDPRELFHRIFYVYILNAQKLCGCEILQPNYKPHKVTFGAIFFVCTFIVASAYTIATYETEIKFKCLCVVPSTLQILVKFLMVVRYYKQMADKIQLLQHIYNVNHRPGTAYYEALVESSRFGFKVCRGATIVLTVVIVYTLAFNLLTNKSKPLLGAYVYGIDQTTVVGHYTMFVYHFLVIFIWCIGILCADNLMAMFVVHMIPMMQILANMFEQMNERLRAGIRFEGSVEFDGFFRNTIQVHKEICDYISGIADYYYFYSMFEVYSDALTMCVGIYSILVIRDYQVSSLMSFTMVKLLVFCLLGTMVENTTSDIYSTIIQSDWNAMPIKTQKMVGLMMARAQNPAILMAGTMPLNLDTFVNVMKTVYSVGMLLVESTA